MNEPKRKPGRPTNAEREARLLQVPRMNGDTSREPEEALRPVVELPVLEMPPKAPLATDPFPPSERAAVATWVSAFVAAAATPDGIAAVKQLKADMEPKVDESLKMAALADVEANSKDPAKGNAQYEHVHSRSDIHDIAQAYAMRVWSGQASDLKRAERIARCKRALEGQNLPTEGVKFPGSEDDDEWSEDDMKPVTWRKDRQ
jgi:hypothetical protein